jgi:hypothetical protein
MARRPRKRPSNHGLLCGACPWAVLRTDPGLAMTIGAAEPA